MFISLLQNRRSIRRYKDQPVEAEKIDRLIEAALRSPSSRGINPWEFIAVTDKALLKKLSEAKPHGASFLKNAPLGIVVLAHSEKSDVWVEDAAIASILIHLAAAAMDLGSCWIQMRKRMHNDNLSAEDYIAALLGIPSGLQVESIIAIGYPDEQKAPRGTETLAYEKVHANVYGNRFDAAK